MWDLSLHRQEAVFDTDAGARRLVLGADVGSASRSAHAIAANIYEHSKRRIRSEVGGIFGLRFRKNLDIVR